MNEQLQPDRPRPTPEDHEAFKEMQSTVLKRALQDVKVWRSGYAILTSGVTILLTFIGTQLNDDVGVAWRLALTLSLGAGIVFLGVALIIILRIEGGKRLIDVNLEQIVTKHNSVEMYNVHQAGIARERLDRSKVWALCGALCCFLGFLCTLWISFSPATTDDSQTSISGTSTTAPTSPTSPQ